MNRQQRAAVCYNSELYERIRVLGQGSFGTAIVHRRRTDCALVVLKEINLIKIKNESDKLLAVQEARIMSKLNHENIIKYYDAYTTDSKLIIEMEYARMGTLQTCLASQQMNSLLEEEEILDILRQIGLGLSYLHSKNIVHLDLKVANIFISADGTIKIGDFGIAQFISSSSSSSSTSSSVSIDHAKQCNNLGRTNKSLEIKNHNQHLGTLAYSSPERCLGLETDYKSDIWSLGCILYELITLKLLFPSESLSELVMSITRIRYRPIDRIDISRLTIDMFEQMIAKNPIDRPNASDLVKSIDEIMVHLEDQSYKKQSTKHQPYHLKPHHQGIDRNRRRMVGCELLRDNEVISNEATLNMVHQIKRNNLNQINCPHSLIYQVRLDLCHIRVDRINLPQTKRIKEIVKGKSHYLALTYDHIVYGWGSRNKGQLGTCLNFSNQNGAFKSNQGANHVARKSFTARDSAKFLPARNGLKNQVSFTQPPSLASSTQTIVPANSASAPLNNQLAGLDKIDLLKSSEPVRKPFILNELNRRKIDRVAAGNDFSVFLSKTGILMTCGDGSTGCLGRGHLESSWSPCMVDRLLNLDVVSVACGPEHVVAVCGNGQAYTWGNLGAGRLGLSSEILNNVQIKARQRYITVPQLVEFNQLISTGTIGETPFIMNAFCGDKSTIFIDSNHCCWACGENLHNKLGLDVKQRFKRTILVQNAWLPTKISALHKQKIISCSIGRSHSTFLTIEGKMIVCGQDIDHSYRFKRNMMMLDESRVKNHSRISMKMHKTSDKNDLKLLKSYSENRNSCFLQDEHSSYHHNQLIHSLLVENQLLNYKISTSKSIGQINRLNANEGEKLIVSTNKRRQIEQYLKKSRACKKVPLDCVVVSVGCNSRFTLALTNDNRVYFWGTRSHDGEEHQSSAKRSFSVEPQLVSDNQDDCSIKIGTTNSTLMDNIELLGSDQPIIHARDPRLTANSLADLWILDYNPNLGLSTLDCSSTSSCSGSSCCGCNSCNTESTCSCSLDDLFIDQELKHDAILEPQPIVSLYVPSMFNHSGGALKVVNLHCNDEDRFFLILDTTIKMQSQQPKQATGRHVTRNESARLLEPSRQSMMRAVESVHNSFHSLNYDDCGGGAGDKSNEFRRLHNKDDSLLQLKTGLECCDLDGNHNKRSGEQQNDLLEATLNQSFVSNNEEDTQGNDMLPSPISNNGLSLEEPRSMSTFTANMGNHIILNSALNSKHCERPLKRLNFDPYRGQGADFGLPGLFKSDQWSNNRRRRRRRHRSMVNLSESTAATTCDGLDETSSMPTWVRNEFTQHQTIAAEQAAEDSTCVTEETYSADNDANKSIKTSSSYSSNPDTLSGRVNTSDEQVNFASDTNTSCSIQSLNSTVIGPALKRTTTQNSIRPRSFTQGSCDNLISSQLLNHQPKSSTSLVNLRKLDIVIGHEYSSNLIEAQKDEQIIEANILNCSIYRPKKDCNINQTRKQYHKSYSWPNSASSGLLQNKAEKMDIETVGDSKFVYSNNITSWKDTEANLKTSNDHSDDSKHSLNNGMKSDSREFIFDRCSSSLLEARNRSLETTMIEMLNRRSETGHQTRLSKSMQPINVLDEKNESGRSMTSNQRTKLGSRNSLSSIRKSLVRIFC